MDGIHYFDVSASFPYKNLFVITNVVGTLVELLCTLHILIVLKLFSKITVIHRHLKIISYSLWIGLLLRSVGNMSFYISNIFLWNPLGSGNAKFWYDTIRDILNMTIYMLPIPNVCERFYAAVYANVYENYFSLKFVVVLCATSWLASIWCTVHLTWFNEVLSIFYLYLVFNIVTIASYVLYFAYYYYQKSKSAKFHVTSSLSERYQRVENQACSQTILGFAIVSTIIDILATLHNVYALYYLPYVFPEVKYSDKVAFFRALLTICTSLVLLALPRYFVYINATLLRRYNETLLKCLRTTRVSSSTDTGIQIKSISGNINLVLPDETNYYFESLEKQWNSNLDSKTTKS